MRIETGTTSPSKPGVGLSPPIKRRVRTDAGRLTREAEQRRNRANGVFVASIVAVVALVRLCYVLLTR